MLFWYINIYINGEKAVVGKTSGTLTWIKLETQSCSSSSCILQHYTFAADKKNILISLLKDVLDKTIKILILLNLDHSICLFYYSTQWNGNIDKELMLHTKVCNSSH